LRRIALGHDAGEHFALHDQQRADMMPAMARIASSTGASALRENTARSLRIEQ